MKDETSISLQNVINRLEKKENKSDLTTSILQLHKPYSADKLYFRCLENVITHYFHLFHGIKKQADYIGLSNSDIDVLDDFCDYLNKF